MYLQSARGSTTKEYIIGTGNDPGLGMKSLGKNICKITTWEGNTLFNLFINDLYSWVSCHVIYLNGVNFK